MARRLTGVTGSIIGHEGLGQVLEGAAGSGFEPGNLVVGIVRRPDPVPCPACAAGEWDMCRNDLFTERGITGRDGYGSELWRVEHDFAVRVPVELGDCGVLLEPASVVAKAWDQVDQISERAFFIHGRALVTGAGPIGLLACLLGVQRGYEMHVVDLPVRGPKRDLVEELGAHYHAGDAADIGVEVDVVLECTGLGVVGRSAARRLASGGIMRLAGIMDSDPHLDTDATALNRAMVLHNQGPLRNGERRSAPLGAGRRSARRGRPGMALEPDHSQGAAVRWTEALTREPNDIKVVVDLAT